MKKGLNFVNDGGSLLYFLFFLEHDVVVGWSVVENLSISFNRCGRVAVLLPDTNRTVESELKQLVYK